MNHNYRKTYRLLAVALSSRGLGYAVLEGEEFLVESGKSSFKGDKNRRCLAKAEKLVSMYLPDALVLQDAMAKDFHRGLRIKALNQKIAEAARKRNLKVALISGRQLRSVLLGDAHGTKQEMAEILAKCFPDELALRLPPQRRSWESEDARMDIFDAVGLAVGHQMSEAKKAAGEVE